jgi:ATP-binding cassette subfamily C protein CydD
MLNKRLLKESKIKKPYLVISALAPLFNGIFIVISAYLLANIVVGVFNRSKDIREVSFYIILFLINAVFRNLVNFFCELYIKNSAEDIKAHIRDDVLNLIINSNPYKVKNEKIGELINVLTEAMDMLSQYYSEYIPQFFSAFLIPLIIFIGVFSVDKISALIMLITYPIIPILMILVGSKAKEANEKQWNKLITLSTHFIEILQGLTTLKIFGKSKLQEEKIFKISENYRKATMEVLKVSFLSALVLELLSTISTAVVAVNLGLRLVYSNISFLSAFFILVVTPDFYLPMRSLGLKFHSSLNGVVALEKIEKIEGSLYEENIKTENVKKDKNKFEVEVKGLNFVYENKKVLKDINFKIRNGEKVAIIGESGSGKSTLLNILAGFLKVEDNTVFVNGKDINSIDRKDYLDKLCLVPQFPHIFNQSIEKNIVVGYDAIKEEKLKDISDSVRIEEFANIAPKRYDTIIGDGENFTVSGGEAQRIAIARAVIKNSDFIIFDEPSSALDAEKEEIIVEIIEKYFKQNTVIIAAHRLNTIKNVDKIILILDGCINEIGTHEELMKNKGKYYELLSRLEVDI